MKKKVKIRESVWERLGADLEQMALVTFALTRESVSRTRGNRRSKQVWVAVQAPSRAIKTRLLGWHDPANTHLLKFKTLMTDATVGVTSTERSWPRSEVVAG